MSKSNTRKALNPAYRKHKPIRKNVNQFVEQLKECLVSIKWIDDNNESEEHLKEPLKNFLQNTFYSENHINTKDRIDLAIYLGKNAKSDVGVIIEAKKPSNKAEFLTPHNLNRKALQELLLYYLRERLDNKNNSIKHLIATNGYEWYLFKAEDFYNIFFKNKPLIKEYEAFRDGLKDTTKNELFYNEIAKKYIAQVQDELPFVHLDFNKTNFDTLSDAHLNTLYKVFSNVHLLGQSFGNDSNQLNKVFYNELLHIIGLEEIKDKGKKIIYRKSDKTRDYASLLENTIFALEDKDYLRNVKGFNSDGDKPFNVGLDLCLTWINRILFLKLLESQLLTYHKGAKEYKFLQSDFIKGFDDLNNLFFSALAKKTEERHPRYKEHFKNIPYLNSSLFERNSIETDTFEISALNDDEMEVLSTTVLKDANGKRFKGKLNTLDYLFKFLDAYDFATDGTEGIADEHENKTLINASVLGLIFEKINGYKEGSFYTPAYITMYMCKESLRSAVVQKFKEQENDQIETFENLKAYCHRFFKVEDTTRFNKIINTLRICDPAVGSGHFLVSALNELIVIKNELGILIDAKGMALRCDIQIENDELYITDDSGFLYEYNPHIKESARIQHTLFHEKQTLIENCLFGVDINPNSVKICRLRLWIELLKNAYYTSNNELQTLPNIDINIKCGNSLISRFDLKDDLKDAFKGKEVKYNFKDYKKAVEDYKNTNSKEQKREVLEIIEAVKYNFKSTLDNTFIDKFIKIQEEFILENERINNLKKFEENISKAEKDRLAALKLKLEKAFAEKEEIVNNAIYNSAFEWRFEFPEVLDDLGNYIGFDVVIGNPPYMRVQEIQASQPNQKIYYETQYQNAKAAYDLANLFFELAINISNTKAHNTFIFPHKFFNSASSEVFRNYLIEGKFIDKVAHFGANMVFEDADTYTCIAWFSKHQNEGFEFQQFPFKSDFQNLMTKNENYSLMSYKMIHKASQLYGSNQWIMFNNELGFNIFEKIYNESKLFADAFEGIFQGLATSKDDLYILEMTDKDSFKFKVPISGKEYELEKELFKPFLMGKDVQRYSYLTTNRFVFFPYKLKNGNAEIVSIEEIKEKYPKTYQYVIDHEKIFRDRESGKAGKMQHWHAYIYPKNLNKFEQPKLTSMEICANHPNVTLNLENLYHTTKAYSWVKKEETKESYEYLLSIANSKLLWWFLKTTGDTLQGDARTFKTNYLNPFPLPIIVGQEIENNISEKVKLVMEQKKLNSKGNTTTIEKEIDQLVYELYELTEEEIAIVENS
ncbi:MAG: Eco57I restriction-modification methylase domain-containing protein [Lutibacter sp.]|jgi:hypothetical protein